MAYAIISGTASTSAQYPTDGIGGASTTSAASNISGDAVTVSMLLLTAAANGNITIENHGGTGDLVIPIVSTLVCPYPIPLGGDRDAVFNKGVRFTSSASGLIFTAFYRNKASD